MRHKFHFVLGTAALAVCGTLSAFGADSKEDFRYTFTLVNGRIDLSSFNGAVEIMGGDTNTVEITGSKYANEQANLSKVQVEAVQEGSLIRIRASKPKEGSGWNCNCGVKFTIRTPRKTDLASIRSSNGGIRVENIEGAANLGTSNGGVELRSVSGAVSVTTSNGPVTVENVRGGLQVKTSNGAIRGRLTDTAGGAPIQLSTSNGAIDLRIEATHNNDITASTSNGSITIRMPETANGRISAATSNHDSIVTDLPIQVRGTLSKGSLDGTLGNGSGPMIKAQTSNGAIRILKL